MTELHEERALTFLEEMGARVVTDAPGYGPDHIEWARGMHGLWYALNVSAAPCRWQQLVATFPEYRVVYA